MTSPNYYIFQEPYLRCLPNKNDILKISKSPDLTMCRTNKTSERKRKNKVLMADQGKKKKKERDEIKKYRKMELSLRFLIETIRYFMI